MGLKIDTVSGATGANVPTNTAVTSTAAVVLAANAARREMVIVNTDVLTVYLGFGQNPTSTSYHVALSPCGSAHDGTGGTFISDVWKGSVIAVVASATGHIAVTEMI